MPVSLEIIGRCRTSVSSASRNEENCRGSLSCSKDVDWNPFSSIVYSPQSWCIRLHVCWPPYLSRHVQLRCP